MVLEVSTVVTSGGGRVSDDEGRGVAARVRAVFYFLSRVVVSHMSSF